MYCCGFSFKTIGMILYYHDTTIMRWIGEFADKHCQKPVSKGEVLIELDEMRRFVASKKAQLEFEKHAEEQAERFLSGNAKIEIPRLLQDCIVD